MLASAQCQQPAPSIAAHLQFVCDGQLLPQAVAPHLASRGRLRTRMLMPRSPRSLSLSLDILADSQQQY